MAGSTGSTREGSLEAPTRHALNWNDPGFYDREALFAELERVFEICHGCRRCVSLCNSFPTLFDLVDESDTMELDGVAQQDYWRVVDHCYLCDLCYMTKCPYVPPHEWNVDFPHLMLRAKAFHFKHGKTKLRDKVLTSTDAVGRLASIPVVSQTVNAVNRLGTMRNVLDKGFGVHPEAHIPAYHSATLRKRLAKHQGPQLEPVAAGGTQGRVALFATCYGNYNEPQLGEDLVAVFEHNDILVQLAEDTRCCGMPKLELGDLESVQEAKQANVPRLAKLVDAGWDIVAPVPSCVLMFKQELPLMFPDDPEVAKVQQAMFDPFEYLMLRHKEGKLRTDFARSLGKIAYQTACHLRVQNMGLKTRDLLQLIPDTELEVIERCSGHDGTYAVKSEFHDAAMKIGRPVFNRVAKAEADYYSSDCPIAGHQIAEGLDSGKEPTHPLTLLRMAYGI